MNTTEAAELAAELRKTAQDLLLCVNVIVGQEQSLSCWPCVRRRAPSPICHPSGRSGMRPVQTIFRPC